MAVSSVQIAARKFYVSAQSIPGIKGYYAKPGGLYDRALNKVLGFRENSARLAHLSILTAPIYFEKPHVNWAEIDQLLLSIRSSAASLRYGIEAKRSLGDIGVRKVSNIGLDSHLEQAARYNTSSLLFAEETQPFQVTDAPARPKLGLQPGKSIIFYDNLPIESGRPFIPTTAKQRDDLFYMNPPVIKNNLEQKPRWNESLSLFPPKPKGILQRILEWFRS